MDVSGVPAGEDGDGTFDPVISRGSAPADITSAAGDALPVLEPAPVDNLDELPGDYYRPFALPGQISVVSLTAGSLPEEGEYNLFRSCGVPVCVPETGTYHAVPENPAVGFAFIRLSWKSGFAELTDSYIIDALWRNSDDELVALEMRRILPGDVIGAPFYLYRQRWTAPEDIEPDPVLSLVNELTAAELVEVTELEPSLADSIASRRQSQGLFASRAEVSDVVDSGDAVVYSAESAGLCAYYQGLAQYYGIRALQCAYSVCYPLSPWYGFWAEYYNDLAQSVCGDE